MDTILRYIQNIRPIKVPHHRTHHQDAGPPHVSRRRSYTQSMEPTDVLSYAKELGIFHQKPMVGRMWSRIISPFPKLDSPLTCPYKSH